MAGATSSAYRCRSRFAALHALRGIQLNPFARTDRRVPVRAPSLRCSLRGPSELLRFVAAAMRAAYLLVHRNLVPGFFGLPSAYHDKRASVRGEFAFYPFELCMS